MSYDNTFQDTIKGVDGGNLIYGVNDNGDVFVTEYGDSVGDFYLGCYQKISLLPNNPYNWDLDSIPAVKDFHVWIIGRMKEIKILLEVKDAFLIEFNNVRSLDTFKNLLLNTIKSLDVEAKLK